MFNESYKHPLEIFSWQHLVALGTVLAVVLIVFFCRKFFIKYSIADKIFRYFMAFVMAFFEIFLHLYNGFTPIVDNFLRPVPLCGFMLWFSVIILISDNAKLEKLIYPLALLGSLMSLFVVDMQYTFPHFEAFKFFFTHALFLLTALYYFFTRKITKYTLKDLGKSSLFLFLMSTINLILTIASKNIEDPYFIISPPGDLKFIKDALGQVGYTIAFIVLVCIVLFSIYGITYLCTRNRKEEELNKPKIINNKNTKNLADFINKNKNLLTIVLIGFSVYVTTLSNITNNVVLIILDFICFFGLITYFSLLGVVRNYNDFYSNNELKQLNLDKIDNNEINKNEDSIEVNDEPKKVKVETTTTKKSKQTK